MPSRKPSKFGNKFRSSAASFNPKRTKTIEFSSLRSTEATSQDEKFEAIRLANSIDESLGFPRFESGEKRVGWLINMHSTSIEDPNVPGGRAGVDYYFLEDGGGSFKATVEYDPYFLIAVKKGRETEVEDWCRRAFEGLIKKITRVEKEDLKLPNHLLGYKRTFLQLNFASVSHLLEVRKTLLPLAEKNKKNVNVMDTYMEISSANAGFDLFDDELINESRSNATMNASDFIIDIREYDVPYHVRVSIDKDIRIGKWYTVEAKHGVISLTCIEERLTRADPVVLAFDIETTKLPLKFPDSVIDQIMMISYMIDGQGFLITNREIVSEDINDFEYTPKPEYSGPFMIFNEPDERGVLERFFEHIKEAKPTVIATYNGDFFDWPFVEARASVLGIDMYREIGFRKNSEDIYQSDHCVHMDCFAWVNRDSYLPQGSRGLKAVTVAKLGYDPDELDPELMTPYASERPQTLAEYSVSDAVATYYLYMKYVHPFIFSLCTILPINPDDTLRKGTGTLCEMLLMVQAYQGNIVLPNKHKDPPESFYEGHLLESETYVGGHVESIEAGVFRSDIPVTFNVQPSAIDELLRDLDAALKFSIEVEEKKSMDDVTNYEEVKKQIADKLIDLKERPHRDEVPFIYHLDVASMYPNIMITNRLQPDSMIQESNCAACDFNRPGKSCDRRMPWAWRGEFLPAKRDEYNMIRQAVANERFPGKHKNSPMRSFGDMSIEEQAGIVKKRLQDYSKKIYHKIHDSKTMVREAIICQRENPFYVDTVRSFRDRRYDFKGKQKVWKGKTDALKSSGASAAEVEEAKKMIVLYDSLQLAHKVILNSFYGYVMRKGSRWYSMEMAGVTCLTGARIIQMARELVERIGRPLELDTDGIWCMLPGSFPENFSFTLKNGKKLGISYPCVMLNHLVHGSYTNHQYQTLVDPATFRYDRNSENSIFFEVDGPYRAMILPTSKEEDKNLKKRYAVFNHDGSLAELKGFEVKRRGELKLIKIFQTQIFRFFLEGTNLTETYAAVAKVADRWLDVLYEHGATLADEELIDLISENRSMTKTLEEYGNQKSTSITTARRLAEFLGEQMVKDKGLNCKYIISSKPRNTPVTERAIPVAIFSAEENVKRFFLRKWLKDDPGDMDPRTVIDWDYYLERLGSVVQKLITIPAALQKIRNPVPRVAHPDWLQRRINTKDDRFKQTKMTDMFIKSDKQEKNPLTDISTNILDHRVQHTGDLDEALANSTQKLKPSSETKVSQKRKHPEGLSKTSLDPFATLPAKMPSMADDYVGFLKYQKQKWKIQKQARIRRRQLFGERANAGGDSLSNLFRNQAELLYINTWQILQLSETGRPGIVRAFVLIDRKIHALTVKVPRQIYVNLKQDSLPDVDVPDCEVEKVNHTLPNGHPSVHLFKLTLSEETYLSEAEKIDVLFQHPSVEGVYEKNIPLNIRAVLKLGSICTFDEEQRGVLGEGLDRGFDLSTLCRTTTEQPYLLDSPLAFHYLYHVASGDRQIFALFSSTKNEAHVVILNRTRDVQGLPNLDKIYSELLTRRMQTMEGDPSQTAFEYQEKIHFRTTQVTTRRKAHLEVGDLIKKFKSEETMPAVMVIQSQQRKRLCHDIPILREYPTLPVKPEVSDMDLPPLGWQSFIARRLVTHYLYLSAWIQHLTLLARYGDVPLCNLENDDPRFLIDISYARRLQQNNVVLWWSSNPRPDHAGYEKDDISGPLEKVSMPSVNVPSAYTTVCIELEVRNLAINTILTSSIINEMEGADTLLASSGQSADPNGGGVLYSEKAFASAGAVVLREMVKHWWTEACDGNSMADIMVQHLIRWVESPVSCLYDRSLHHYVRMLSRKSFQRLMAEFRRVGSNVIFASSTRLLLQTSKTEVGNAYAYSQYVLKSIRANPSFHFIDLEIKEYWDYLLWYDEYNYGGKGCQEVVESDEQELETVMHWQLNRTLPTPMQTIFHDWVVEYIELMHGLKRPDTNDSTPRLTQIPIGRPSDEDSQEVSAALAEKFSKPLKKQITGLIRRQRDELLHPELASDYIFPVLPGVLSDPNEEKRNPVLELVKLLMQVLSLSKMTTMETRLLRRELLALFEVREFSKEGRFENPGASLKIPELTCGSCCLIRDLDLCRDEDVLPEPGVDAGKTSTKPWRCPFCQTEYDRLAQEEILIGQIQGYIVGWQTQDLKCSKCGTLKVSDFMEHCSCSGVWVETMDRKEIERKLQVLNSVAKFHGLKLLESVVGEVLAQM
ncbi:DNA polymerase epsilon catalytic subunit POL2 [Aspergillus luchuensis]|uniref:DNA polymerase epsilon catalytic subunit n=1 Tax=Aspergillus kawachii TaxID=1069201 RepID=A0A7R7X5G0_ASPKA|nr:DNA polymerase epsilon catalytic subunit [Aspergillus luchuensis]BCS03390.1 DNA polymerase epsilon catalytic subunit [Aspergillus luchuensis]BCS15018.1 DNA polymerase epsilon catalytic subunit [Aspergillus luchuensis]GAA84919.1 DNA polymerase epsilon, catalytic subunit A/POL2 [Aspergillus luchuensis IFO 4308]